MNLTNFQEEFSDYLRAGYELLLTADGSPTLVPNSSKNHSTEPMHSKSGAIKESHYIYHNAGEALLNLESLGKSPIQVISVGLGLGYNEILIGDLLLNRGLDFNIISFESEKKLIGLFEKRLNEFEKHPCYWKGFQDYLTTDSLRDFTEKIQEKIEFHGALGRESLSEISSHITSLVLFDAYSNKTSPDLWDEDFLTDFCGRLGRPSVFSTYASTGTLNRSFKRSGFSKIKKKGFHNKRESTLAYKL